MLVWAFQEYNVLNTHYFKYTLLTIQDTISTEQL